MSKIAAPDMRGRELFDLDVAAAIRQRKLVEPDGIEPTTSCLQSTRSPN